MLLKIDLHKWSKLRFISMKQYWLFAVLSVSKVIFAMAFVKKEQENVFPFNQSIKIIS